MSNKVLIAIDHTGLSTLVVGALSSQMHPDQTEVLVVQVLEPLVYSIPPEMSYGYGPELAERQKQIREEAKGSLDSAVEIFRNAGFKASSRLVESEVKEGILGVASEWDADMIVVTSHARKGMAKLFHSSVAEAIVHRASCSVLVLKEVAKEVAA